MIEPPLSLRILPGQGVLTPAATTALHLLIRVQAAQAPTGPQPRLAAVLVLDVSGSMAGEPIAQVKGSVERLVEILGEEDSLGVVSFATGAQMVAPLAPVGQARKAVRRAVGRLAADGNTNLSGGLAHAALLFSAGAPDERQLALVLSDGQPNVGAQTPEALRAEVELLRRRGIAVSSLGFGASHNEDVLVAIAEAGGGRYAYVKDPQLADTSFARALGAQRDVVADNVRLVLTPSPGVEIIRVLGHPRTTIGADGLRVNLPDALIGDVHDVVVQLQVRTRKEPGAFRLLRLLCAARVVGTGEELTHREDVEVQLSALGPDAPDPTVAAAAALGLAQELRAEARSLSDRGNFPGAVAILRRACDLLRAAPGFSAGGEGPLCDAYEVLLDDIATMEQAPDAEQYNVYRKAQFDYQAMGAGRNQLQGTPGTQLLDQRMQATRGAVPPARLLIIAGDGVGRELRLGAVMRIGRAAGNEIVLSDSGATRTHAHITWQGQDFVVVDMGSSNGTFVNGKRVDRCALSHGDTLAVGGTVFRFERQG